MALLKAQSALELAAVVLLALFILIPLIIFGYRNLASDSQFSQAQISVRQLASAADTVAAQGQGARSELTVYIPSSIDSTSPKTYITAREISMTVNLTQGPTQVYEVTKAPVNGSFPNKAYGNYVFTVYLDYGGLVQIRGKGT